MHLYYIILHLCTSAQEMVLASLPLMGRATGLGDLGLAGLGPRLPAVAEPGFEPGCRLWPDGLTVALLHCRQGEGLNEGMSKNPV